MWLQRYWAVLQMGLNIYWALYKWGCKYIGHLTNGIANILGTLQMGLQIYWAVYQWYCKYVGQCQSRSPPPVSQQMFEPKRSVLLCTLCRSIVCCMLSIDRRTARSTQAAYSLKTIHTSDRQIISMIYSHYSSTVDDLDLSGRVDSFLICMICMICVI